MDNVTHTLIGVALGHSLGRRQDSEPEPRLKKAILWAALIGSNIADGDFVVNFLPWDGAKRITYLLHHRGFTHTLLSSIPLALLTVALACLIARLRPKKWTKDLAPVALSAWLGIFLHVAADACNDYGVHPFSPFLNNWVYGDFLFIVEPTIWMGLLPFAFFQAETRWGKALCLLLGAGILGAAWTLHVAPAPIAIVLSLWAIACAAFQYHFKTSLGRPVAALLVVVATFFFGSRAAKHEVEAELSHLAPQERILQLSSTPAPADPLCWRTVVSTLGTDDLYRARIGTVSLAPSLLPLESCYFRDQEPHSAPMEASSLPDTWFIHWKGQFTAPIREAQTAATESCLFAAFLRFSRFPFWMREQDAQGKPIWRMGDLRYDRGRHSFSEFSETTDSCPTLGALWSPPSGLATGDRR